MLEPILEAKARMSLVPIFLVKRDLRALASSEANSVVLENVTAGGICCSWEYKLSVDQPKVD